MDVFRRPERLSDMIAQSVDNQDFGEIAILPKYLDSQERMVSRDILASSIFHQRKSEHLL